VKLMSCGVRYRRTRSTRGTGPNLLCARCHWNTLDRATRRALFHCRPKVLAQHGVVVVVDLDEIASAH
jgi:hypothetical protein